jgi:hypothetical protein
VTAPGRSIPVLRSAARDSGTRRTASTAVAMPIGTLTKKIHSQLSRSVRMPPSSRPNAPPPAAIALHTPSALVRSSPSAKVVVMIESAAGETSAPPRPCNARAATSQVSEVARPFNSEANEKIATPQRKSLRRPKRSPARPPSSRKPPNTSVYPLITHCRLAGEKPGSAWMDGSATLTTVASSTTMNWARQRSTTRATGSTRRTRAARRSRLDAQRRRWTLRPPGMGSGGRGSGDDPPGAREASSKRSSRSTSRVRQRPHTFVRREL